MEKQLKKLKESMNRTVFKKGLMDNNEKNRILEAVLKGTVKPKRYFLAPVLTTIFLISFFLFIGSFVFEKIEEENKESRSADKTVEEDLTKNPYVVLDGYYYRKTNEDVTADQLGSKVGEVKRIGMWAIKRTGDSNEIGPGPIFLIKGKDKDYIAGKGINGQNEESYLVFRKVDKVKEINKNYILSASNDPEETSIAFQNIKNKIGTLYGFVNINSRTQLTLVSYSKGPIIRFIYNVTNGLEPDTNSNVLMFIYQYHKDTKLEQTRFIKPIVYDGTVKDSNGNNIDKIREINWNKPQLIESFSMNNIDWKVYNDSYYNDFVVTGQTEEYNIEITTQGEFSIDRMKDLLKYYKNVE